MRRIVTALAVVVFAAGAGIVTAAPAAAGDSDSRHRGHTIRTSPYVAMGDSYSAAPGVHPQAPDAPAPCHQSLVNFAHEIARLVESRSFTDVSCSGAKTADFFSAQDEGVAPQLDAVSRRTRLVTMTIGGNDGNAFRSILDGCVNASLASGSFLGNPCEQQFGSTLLEIVDQEIYPNVVNALNAVRKKAPRATVAILGYPRVMPDEGNPACYPVMPISMGDVPYVTEWEEALNSAVEKAAAETGAQYIDMWESSADRDVCRPADQRWVEPLIDPINADPVHPNTAGQAAMAAATLDQLGIDVPDGDCDRPGEKDGDEQ